MYTKLSQEWWRWKMYKQIADFIHNPSMEREEHITDMLTEYRYYSSSKTTLRPIFAAKHTSAGGKIVPPM